MLPIVSGADWDWGSPLPWGSWTSSTLPPHSWDSRRALVCCSVGRGGRGGQVVSGSTGRPLDRRIDGERTKAGWSTRAWHRGSAPSARSPRQKRPPTSSNDRDVGNRTRHVKAWFCDSSVRTRFIFVEEWLVDSNFFHRHHLRRSIKKIYMRSLGEGGMPLTNSPMVCFFLRNVSNSQAPPGSSHLLYPEWFWHCFVFPLGPLLHFNQPRGVVFWRMFSFHFPCSSTACWKLHTHTHGIPWNLHPDWIATHCADGV